MFFVYLELKRCRHQFLQWIPRWLGPPLTDNKNRNYTTFNIGYNTTTLTYNTTFNTTFNICMWKVGV